MILNIRNLKDQKLKIIKIKIGYIRQRIEKPRLNYQKLKMKIINNKTNNLLKHKMSVKIKKNKVIYNQMQMNIIDKQKC